MKYAIFSDIHGNCPALEAALSDAGKQGIDKFLFLGDYCSTFPWADEVAKIIRGLRGSAVVIRGNGEGYLINLRGQNQAEWIHEQFKPIYYSYKTLSPENLEYLTTLPENAVVAGNGGDIYLAHSMNIFYRSPRIKFFHSSYFRTQMEESPFSHEEYLALAREELTSRPDALEDIESLPERVYLFGHNHLQFHTEYKGRIFINPGSCGVAIDCDTTAAYTVLEQTGSGCNICERRVKYDIEATAEKLRSSGLAAEAPVWTALIERQLRTGKDYFSDFVRHLVNTGKNLGRNEYPLNNDIWDIAVETFNF